MSANRYPQTVFVLGTNRDIGKTVTSIGIIAKLLSEEHGYARREIGYMKPVGQQTLTVLSGEGIPIEADKDAVLITSLMDIECHGYEKVSPVVWRGGVTASFIDEAAEGSPEEGRQIYLQRIRDAYEYVSEGKRIVIVEGTGQPGVGSVAGISNADVINALREMGVPVFVVMVTRGGIGSTLDEVFPYLMALDSLGTRVDGLVVNDVIPSKIDKIQHYLETYYTKVFMPLYGSYLRSQDALRILGFVPSVPELRLPTMRLVADHMARRKDSLMEIVAPADFDVAALDLIHSLKVISLHSGYEHYLTTGDAVIVGVNANDVILSILLHHERLTRKEGKGLAGLILSCEHVGGLAPQIRELVQGSDLPTITLDYDSADIVQRIEGMTVKVQPYDAVKRDLIAEAYRNNLSLWSAAGFPG